MRCWHCGEKTFLYLCLPVSDAQDHWHAVGTVSGTAAALAGLRGVAAATGGRGSGHHHVPWQVSSRREEGWGGGVAREMDMRGAGLQQIGDRHDITTDAERA